MLPYNQKYLVIDTETEGLNLHSSKTWQLSWIVCQGNKILEEHDEFITHKNLNIPEVVKKMTGFNWDKYNEKSKSLSKVWSKFEQYLYDPQYVIVGQNLLGFDVYIHNIYRKLLGLDSDFSYIKRIYDTNCVAKAIKKGMKTPNSLDKFIQWQYRLNDFRERNLRTSIKAQLKQYKIDFDENKLHDSLYDVQMNLKIFRKQLTQIDL